jgi:hypothetical protein
VGLPARQPVASEHRIAKRSELPAAIAASDGSPR